MRARPTRIAAYVTELGPADRIRVGELPVPPIGPTDVVVAVDALAVNHVDTFVRSGRWPTPTPFPFVVGRDLVGRVTAAGPGAAGFAPGDRVWCNSMGHEGRQGSFATEVVVPSERLFRLPEGVDPVEAVAVLHPGATAALGLFRHAGVRPGDTVVVGGGGGAVGSTAVQMAAKAGARVVAAAAPRDGEWCRACGAAEVVDYRDERRHERIAAVTPEGVDVYWDTSGHHDLAATFPVLAPGARVLVTAGIDARTMLPVGALYTHDVRLIGFVLSRAPLADLADAARLIDAGLAGGWLRVRIGERLPLAATAAAHGLVEGRGGRPTAGRVVVTP